MFSKKMVRELMYFEELLKREFKLGLGLNDPNLIEDDE